MQRLILGVINYTHYNTARYSKKRWNGFMHCAVNMAGSRITTGSKLRGPFFLMQLWMLGADVFPESF